LGKYFGTDGFRGEANVTLTATHAFEIGRFFGFYLNEKALRAAARSALFKYFLVILPVTPCD
jgi:phosphoglucosamine mutase